MNTYSTLKHSIVSLCLLLSVVFICHAEIPTDTTTSVGKISRVGMVSMGANDIALRIDNLSLTWGELLQHLNKNGAVTRVGGSGKIQGEVLVNGLNESQQKVVKNQLNRFLRNYIFLVEAKKSGLVVTEEEKEAFVKRWSENFPDKKFDKYIGSFPEESSNPLQMTKADFFLLMKYTDKLLEGVEVPQDEIAQNLSRVKQLTESFDQEQAAMRVEMEKLAENPSLNTDEGFAKLATEYSEGEEAVKGGVLPFELTRGQIAELNYDQTFDTAVGETSKLIETPTALRYIRVLEEIPAERAGEPPTLKIAQILKAKRELEGIPTKEDIEKRVKKHYQERFILEQIAKILKFGMVFDCPIFPKLKEGLLTPPAPKK